jgi:hypothetical protein
MPEYEAICANLPALGFAAATAHIPVSRKGNSAVERLGQTDLEPPDVESC